jgi:hypothetical protein
METPQEQPSKETTKREYVPPELAKREQLKEVTEGAVQVVTPHTV